MNSSTISVKLEPELKQEVQELAGKMGLSLSAVVKAKLREFIRTRELNLTDKEKPSKFLLNSMLQAELERENNETSLLFPDTKNAVEWLNS